MVDKSFMNSIKKNHMATKTEKDSKIVKRIHLMGIGGSGMSGVAYLAEKMGFEISGCDIEESTAYVKNIFKGHDKSHLEGIDFLVISPAIKYQNPDNPEYVEAVKKELQ